MEAVISSETSVNIYKITSCCIPEGSHFHTCRRENLKFQLSVCIVIRQMSPRLKKSFTAPGGGAIAPTPGDAALDNEQ